MKTSLLAIVGGASTAMAAVRGWNYGAQGQTQQSFEAQFRTAASLPGADNYNSVRLYTMIQEGTANSPTSAIQAAINTKSTLLLGLWASQDQGGFSNEITALKNAITQYGSAFADLVVGISVGSEDLYRISPTGIINKSGIGQSPDTLVNYIKQVRGAIAGTSLSSKPVGHVDTWNVYVNSTNNAVISNSDFLGLDEYPYYETTNSNSIGNSKNLFFSAYDKVNAVAQGKPIWITESGYPTSGPESGLAVASVQNAAQYWQDVACELERRNINTWWYILSDAGASPSFGVSNNGVPLYDLSCKAQNTTSTSSSASSSASKSATSSGTAASSTATSIGNGTPHEPQSSASSAISATASSGASGASSASAGSATGPGVAGGYPTGTATTLTSSATGGAAGSSGAAGGAGSASAGTATGSATGSTFTGAASRVVGSAAGLAVAGLAIAAAL